uniref:F-box domain-containing protein n=1 Tax=Kalanchoe fedtschenkoi TaxID=63787 RepID=A0A7N0VDD4_KALFE
MNEHGYWKAANMNHRGPLKIPSSKGMEHDVISNLPGHIMDKILSKLPIREAVRTSILSRKWRYKWITLPELVFDNHCTLVSSQDQIVIKNKLVSIIDHVLLLHIGPIHRFKLSHRDLLAVSDIDRWVLYLSRSMFKELILEIWKGQRYKLPSSLYSMQHLVHLELFNCFLNPPSTFSGFRCLKSLDLQHITMDQEGFENMIASCPQLERLTLMNFDGFSLLKVNAPKLQFFDTGGIFEDVLFLNTEKLAIASIGLYVNVVSDGYPINGSYTSNLARFCSSLPHVERLEVQNYFLKYLAIGNISGRIPSLCPDLCYLSIRINFIDSDENLAALNLLRSCPNLQELELLARPEDQGDITAVAIFFEEANQWDGRLTFLRHIKVSGISSAAQELDFINFLLSVTPSLERMTVKPASLDRGWELVKELLRFRRASVQAEVVFLDP